MHEHKRNPNIAAEMSYIVTLTQDSLHDARKHKRDIYIPICIIYLLIDTKKTTILALKPHPPSGSRGGDFHRMSKHRGSTIDTVIIHRGYSADVGYIATTVLQFEILGGAYQL